MTILLLCGLALELSLAITARLLARTAGDPAGAHLIIFALLLTCVPYLIAVQRAKALDWKQTRWVILLVAVLARLTLLPTPLVLSDDALRYLWEGRVQLAGFNPYRYTPDAPELAGLRDQLWTIMPHHQTLNCYPPLLQAMFTFGASIWPVPAVYKYLFVAFDLATLWFIIQLLRDRGQNPALALIWAWSPLVIVEFAGSAHEMSLPICFLVAGLWLLNRHPVASGIAFAAAVLSHYMAAPIVVATLLIIRADWRRVWLPFALTIAVAYLPFVSAGKYLVMSLVGYAGQFRFNGSAFELLMPVVGFNWPQKGFGPGYWNHPYLKMVIAALFIWVVAWCWRHRCTAPRAALATTAALLLLSPSVHPWYVVWLVPLICFEFRPAWLIYCCTIFISYVAKVSQLQTGQWVDHWYVELIEYAPVYVLLWLHIRQRDRATHLGTC